MNPKMIEKYLKIKEYYSELVNGYEIIIEPLLFEGYYIAVYSDYSLCEPKANAKTIEEAIEKFLLFKKKYENFKREKPTQENTTIGVTSGWWL